MKNMKKDFSQPSRFSQRAFTLIELLIVIAIIGIIAGFTIPVLRAVKRQQYLHTVRVELEQIQTALENFKAQYGVYPPGNTNNALLNQLYYELSGTTQITISGVNYFRTLDGSSTIASANVPNAYGVGGFMNCTKGSVEDGGIAKNFLSGLSSKEIYNGMTNNSYGFNVPNTTVLITSVGGPDTAYQPLNTSGLNPFRYLYPGVNNPGGYDLWVQLVISGKTNLICNWSRQVLINSSLP